MKYALALCGAFLCVGASAAADYPNLKPGLWESQVQVEGGSQASRTRSTQMCMDASVMKEMMQMGQGMQKSMCSKFDSRFSGNKHYGEAVCNIAGSTIKSSSVTTFGSDSYHTDVHATYDPPFMGRTESNTVVEAKWISACPAGMQPGDITGPNGMKMNIRQMQGGK